MQNVKLHPEKTALVIIDMQKGIAAAGRKIEPHDVNEIRKNVAKLVEASRKANVKIFPVHVTGTDGKDMLNPIVDEKPNWGGDRPADWDQFIDEVKPQNGDIPITKRQWGAFYGTELDLQLRRRHIDTIVLCGISTNIGVETTAREAYQHGYNLVLVEDAMGAMTKEEHETSMKFIFPRIGLVRSTAQVISMLA
ncbi:MAG: isochorismatase family protein [Candidatus Micrarchaeaceae archaeon]